MKKNNTEPQSPKGAVVEETGRITVGLDVGDKTSRYCVLDSEGGVQSEGSVGTTRKAKAQKFSGIRRCRIALEVGTHSPWLSRWLSSLGFEVIVANARQVQLISASSRKNDRMDARLLARLARVDPQLLRPIRHRSEQAQADLMAIRIRATLVEVRTGLVNAARGFAKAMGERLPACDTDSMGVEKLEALPAELQQSLRPLLEQIAALTAQIKKLEDNLEQIARTRYPETRLLTQVSGVGTLIALTFVLTEEDGARFQKSRDVGCYVGLRPKQSESGENQPQLRITKEGDRYLRTLLVQGAHLILNRRGPDTDLKRWGLKLAERGGKNAKKRAIVAVARKLAVLLHRLWVCGEVYEPLRNNPSSKSGTQAA
ncbi:MAG: IS110 family RNA-guided transposase [Candidatus Angelobacter sp.]